MALGDLTVTVGFSESGARRIADVVKQVERTSLGGGRGRGRWGARGGGAGRVAKSGGSGVPARSGSTPGTATVRLYDYDGSTLADSGEDVQAFNLSGSAVGNTKWIGLMPIVGGFWQVVWEDC